MTTAAIEPPFSFLATGAGIRIVSPHCLIGAKFMRNFFVCTALFACLVAPEFSAAQDKPTPDGADGASGVQGIMGSKMPSLDVDVNALEAVINEKKSFSAVRDVLQGDGVTSVGQGGITLHIYKAHDTVSAKKLVLILYVKDGVIVDHLVHWLAPNSIGDPFIFWSGRRDSSARP
jgi:hypothetical protein